jgi:hypothetical protein
MLYASRDSGTIDADGRRRDFFNSKTHSIFSALDRGKNGPVPLAVLLRKTEFQADTTPIRVYSAFHKHARRRDGP